MAVRVFEQMLADFRGALDANHRPDGMAYVGTDLAYEPLSHGPRRKQEAKQIIDVAASF